MLSFHIKEVCPICKNKAKEVSSITISSLVKKDYQKKLSSTENFFFCQTSNCEVVYFKLNEIVKQENLIKEVGLKEWSNPKTVCYCFDWTKEKISDEINELGKTNAIEDISKKMGSIGCNCKINNPSGKCCLKDVKKVIKELN